MLVIVGGPGLELQEEEESAGGGGHRRRTD